MLNKAIAGPERRVRPWKWTPRREEAVQLVAADRLRDYAIAARVGISDRQLRRWKHVPEFRQRVAQHREAYREAVFQAGVAARERRLKEASREPGNRRSRKAEADLRRLESLLEERERQLNKPGSTAGGRIG